MVNVCLSWQCLLDFEPIIEVLPAVGGDSEPEMCLFVYLVCVPEFAFCVPLCGGRGTQNRCNYLKSLYICLNWREQMGIGPTRDGIRPSPVLKTGRVTRLRPAPET